MARGPAPKSPQLRQRRNRAATAATLRPRSRAKIPRLPRNGLDPRTRSWWRAVWASPMAAEYLPADEIGLVILADLIERYWKTPGTKLAAEIRQQEARYGISPAARRTLQWAVDRVERDKDRPDAEIEAPTRNNDPRRLLVLDGGMASGKGS